MLNLLQSINTILNLDLIFEILDHLAVPLAFHERKCDLAVLAACSLVCRDWSSRAQRLLFRRIILPHNIHSSPYLRGTSRNSLPSFLEAIDPATERGKQLGACVLSLTLRHTGREVPTYATCLATALLRTPNLRHLNVTTLLCDFDTETLAAIRQRGPRITSLCILQDFSPAVTQHRRIMHQLVAAFPSIRLLEVTSNLSATLAPFDPPANLSLVSVKFNATLANDFGPCLASLMRPDHTEASPKNDGDDEDADNAQTRDGGLQLLSHTSLRSSPSTLSRIFTQHGAHLRSLSLKTLDSAHALQHCTRLERLELGALPHHDHTTILAALPRTLTALSIGGSRAPPPDARAADALVAQLRLLPNLRTLTWRVSGAAPPEALVRMCESRGVEMRVGRSVVGGHGGDGVTDAIDDDAVEVELRRKYIRI